MSFLNSIQNKSKKYEFPFDHWEYNNALDAGAIKEIITADVPDVSKHNLNYDGTRAIDGGEGVFRSGIKMEGKQKKSDVMLLKKTQIDFLNLQNLLKN